MECLLVRVASSAGHSQILSRSCGEKLGKAGIIATSQARNGGLGLYVIWTQFHSSKHVRLLLDCYGNKFH